MDLKKALNQTVRELKREVNKKVLKVPEIETKVLEATSNEPWGPHGSLMAEISHATRNYNEYQMIMSILWKRTLDTGRNWRHVYKAITVFEFLVAHGAERVIDELRERSYQISMLADFQYIDSSGRDQGMNVRKKAQTLASLINDKEKIREVRQKASSNKDKYRGLASTGGLYNKSSSYSSTGGTYGTEDEDRYGRYGRDRDDDRYGRYNSDHQRDDDKYGRDGDRYGMADQNRDDQEEDRNNSVKTNRDYDKYGKDQDRPYDDDDRYSSRSGGGKHDEYIEDDRRLDSKQAGSRMPPPPSYEDALMEGGKGAKNLFVQAQNVPSTNGTQNGFSNAAGTEQGDDFDFDPRGSSVSASDFFGQQSAEQSFATKALPHPAAVAQPPASLSVSSDMFGDTGFNSSVSGGVSSTPAQQPHLEGDLFGDSPFKADGSTSSMATPSAEGNVFMNSTLAAAFPAMPVNADVSNSFNPPPLTGGNMFVTPAASAAITNFPTVTAPNYGDSFKAVGPGTTTQPGYEANFMGDNKSFNSFGSSGITGIGNVPMQTQRQPRTIQSQQPDLMFGFDSQTSSMKAQPKKEKFETKSSVWSNELSNGLIDLNIAGSKSNPLAELGIDLSSSSSLRMERKKEEAKTSTLMGKAMGSGSGVGMAGASVLAPQTAPRPMMGGMGMGMGMGIGMGGMGMGMGMGMAPAPAGMNMGMGMMGMGMQNPNMGMGMGMGMGMSMGMGGSPAIGMGGGPGMGTARPMGMGVGMNGGYPNQQHSYNGPM